MAGYNYEKGMSNNAVKAYNNGIKPLSKITKQDLLAESIDLPLGFCKWLAKKNIWRSYEYHHSGGTWYNSVDFYNVEDLKDALEKLIDENALDALKNEFKTSKSAKNDSDDGVKVKGSYVIWGGSKRSPKKIGEQAFEGVLKGNWIYLNDGSKKKADGNHITYEPI